MKDHEIRKWLEERKSGPHANRDLADFQIHWIMTQEQDETAVLKLERIPGGAPATGGEHAPSAGGRRQETWRQETWQWYIRVGNYTTLAEYFHYGKERLPCFDLYNMYNQLEVWIHPKAHGQSHTAGAQLRRNAKDWKYFQTGSAGWG